MTRTTAREIAMQLGFALAVNDTPADELLSGFFDSEHYATLASEHALFNEPPGEQELSYISRLASGVKEHHTELDGFIEKYSKNWKVARISRTAAAVLRIAMFEILYMDDVPNNAAINEAVELLKGYDDQETVAFVNGILGGFVRGETESS